MNWKKGCLTVLCGAIALPGLALSTTKARADEAIDYIPLTVANAGFEQSATSLPGWNVIPALPATGLEVQIAHNPVFEGSNSVKITDNNSSRSLDVFSTPIPITEGRTYRLTAKVYVESKSVRGYLRFKKSGSSADLAGSANTQLISIKASGNGWQDMTIEGVAPAGAEYAEISFYMGGSGTGTAAYVDNVKLDWKKVTMTQPLNLPYDAPVLIGDAVQYALSQSASYGIGPDGTAEQYVTTVGAPVSFHVVDAVTGALTFSERIATSADTIWGMARASDGNMYFSTNGILYRYLVTERRIEPLGANPSNKQVFDLKASRDGKLYGGTFSSTNLGRVFEYDIATGQFRDLGVMKSGQQYARGLGVTDDYVYVGIGTTAALMRYDRRTGAVDEIVIPGVSGTTKTISEIDVYGDKLFAYSGETLYVIDERSQQLINTITFQTKISPPSPYNPNLIYYKLKGELYTYDMASNRTAKVEGIPELPDDTAIKSHAWISPTTGTFAGRAVLAGMAAFGESFLYDPVTNRYEEHAADLPTSATLGNALEASGSYLFLGGYQRGMSIYDTASGRFVYSNKQFHQPEGIGFLGDAIYFGTYSGARMYRLDMSKPFAYSEFSSGNPGLALDIGDSQDRPFTMTSGDGKLFIGTFPGYGSLGGALTVLEETVTGVTYETFRNVVPNQSIFGLAYRNGKVYGGTSRGGGLGIEPTETEAKLFVFDTATKQVIRTFTPQIPGLRGKANLIGELSIGPDGLLWGIMDGMVDSTGYDAAIFALNPDTLEVVKSKIVTLSPFNTSKYRPYYIRWGQDGLMYTTIGRKLFAIDPQDLRTKQLIPDTVNLMTLGSDGSIYYVIGSKLYKIPVKIGHAIIIADRLALGVGDTASVTASVYLANGLDAEMGGASIQYSSSRPEVATAAGGIITAHSPGTTELSAMVTLDNRTVATASVTVSVVGDRFGELKYQPNGMIKGEIEVDTPPRDGVLRIEAVSPDGAAVSSETIPTSAGDRAKNGVLSYEFKMNIPAHTANQIRLYAYRDGILYSASPWLMRKHSDQ
ncbi:hypothetical protein FE783_09345 [Paenibacillus mesophilus]|uniref:hypothetical protein n=1 Tax=Paenibacillus mesophilus TaxID=2582849 RepID=UPI00110F54E1|nr:hypothetical protein [Paenibacillus mesophilus]TMV50862.1 hypothetical protein FE783_09345 [Paenibacillus mesophilus]